MYQQEAGRADTGEGFDLLSLRIARKVPNLCRKPQ
jgi:hypothetical protein